MKKLSVFLVVLVGLVGSMFAADNTPVTVTLTSGISATDRVLQLSSVGSLSPMTEVMIDSEQLLICSIDSYALTALTCTYGRGRSGSAPVAHASSAVVLVNHTVRKGPDGNVVLENTKVLGTESLTNPNLTSGTSWSSTVDCSLTSNAATCTKSAGTASTISQAAVTLAVAGVANRTYAFTYTISGVTGTPAASITTAFALATTALPLTAGTHTVLFTSAAAPGAFTITTTLTTGQVFTIDTLSLKYVSGGGATALSVRYAPVVLADAPTCTQSLIGTLLYCRDCKNVTDDTTGTLDSTAATGGHGTSILCENETTPAWRVH